MNAEFETLQGRIGYTFKNPSLLERALTHPSWVHDHPDAPGHNQRLEFLGDSVLQLILTEALFGLFPEEREGELTKRRAVLGKGLFLAELARDLGMERCLRLSANEESTGGRSRDAAVEDTFEAVIGAVHLDGGFEAARRTALGIYGDLKGRLAAMEGRANPKGRLQEVVQPEHGNHAVRYQLLAAAGADHERLFEVAVFLHDRQLGAGKGPSKKVAEEEAARAALIVLESDTEGK